MTDQGRVERPSSIEMRRNAIEEQRYGINEGQLRLLPTPTVTRGPACPGLDRSVDVRLIIPLVPLVGDVIFLPTPWSVNLVDL